MGNMLSLFQTKKETLIMFQKDKFWEKQKMYLWETWKKHIICFSDFSFRNTFCVSVGKTLWKSQNMSRNGFFWAKHHPVPAVSVAATMPHQWLCTSTFGRFSSIRKTAQPQHLRLSYKWVVNYFFILKNVTEPDF